MTDVWASVQPFKALAEMRRYNDLCDQGQKAKREGLSLEENPFDTELEKHAWEDGWMSRGYYNNRTD